MDAKDLVTMQNINKGKSAEKTALHFFLKQGWTLVAKNKQLAGVEIDLILKNPAGYLLVEVKSHNQWRTEHPMSYKQKKRLERAFSFFCTTHEEPVQAKLAVVNSDNVVDTFDLEF